MKPSCSQPNFIFVIPLRNPALAQNWDRCVALCRDTLLSALNQTASQSRFRVILVCREFPQGIVEHPCLSIIRHPFPDPDPNWRDQHEDKYLKIRHGLVQARDYAPCYIMKLDADDLVSNRLVKFIQDHDNRLGYYLQHGFRWNDNSCHLHQENEFHMICGSSNILFATPNQLPANIKDDSRTYDLVALGHTVTKEMFADRGTPLTPIPFRAAIYRLKTGENISENYLRDKSVSNTNPNWKFFVGKALFKAMERFQGKKISPLISREFQIVNRENALLKP